MKMLYLKSILGAALASVLIGRCEVYGQGQIEAVNTIPMPEGYSPYINGYAVNQTYGWAFTANQDIVISGLGWIDGWTNANPPAANPPAANPPAANPSAAGLSVGLWSTDGTLLRSVVLNGSGQTLASGSYYESVNPFTVTAGSTLVVGVGSSGPNPYIFNTYPTSYLSSFIDFAGTAFGADNGGFAFPATILPGDDGSPVFAATFLFEVVPEPNESVLFALGAFSLAFCRRRKST